MLSAVTTKPNLLIRTWLRREAEYAAAAPDRKEMKISKYQPLWRHLQSYKDNTFRMSFDEIKAVLGFDIDHSFLNGKKEAAQFGFSVGKISIKQEIVIFNRVRD